MKYRKVKKFKFKKFIIVLCLVLCFISTSIVAYIYLRINPVLARVAQVEVDNMIVEAVNNAIYKVYKDGTIDYNELMTVHKDSNGKINMIQSNNTKINLIAIETAKQAQYEINQITNTKIVLPAGSTTGLPILIGFGPELSLQFLSAGNVKSLFRSEFVSAGINQTKHKIYIDVEAQIQLVLPLSNAIIKSSVPILISESILIGEVPDIYLNPNIWGLSSQNGSLFVP